MWIIDTNVEIKCEVFISRLCKCCVCQCQFWQDGVDLEEKNKLGDVEEEGQYFHDDVEEEAQCLGGDVKEEGQYLHGDVEEEGQYLHGDVEEEGEYLHGDVEKEVQDLHGDVEVEAQYLHGDAGKRHRPYMVMLRKKNTASRVMLR